MHGAATGVRAYLERDAPGEHAGNRAGGVGVTAGSGPGGLERLAALEDLLDEYVGTAGQS